MKNNLKTAISATGKKLQEFARRCGWSSAKISKIIHGLYEPLFEEQALIINQLNHLLPNSKFTYESIFMKSIPEEILKLFDSRKKCKSKK